jgi:glycerate kinase
MDKFKGSATAEVACGSLCEGIQETSTGWRCLQVPLADGGDGTVAALCRAGWDSRSVATIDAQGAVVHAEVALLENTSVVEMANICDWVTSRGFWSAPRTTVSRCFMLASLPF